MTVKVWFLLVVVVVGEAGIIDSKKFTIKYGT
jgi:hypothetical protein